jgi:hypothetical protein
LSERRSLGFARDDKGKEALPSGFVFDGWGRAVSSVAKATIFDGLMMYGLKLAAAR